MLKTELLKISKVDENYEPTNAGSSIKPKHEENEENYTKPHHKLLKTTNKEKILKEPKKRKKATLHTGNKDNSRFFTGECNWENGSISSLNN